MNSTTVREPLKVSLAWRSTAGLFEVLPWPRLSSLRSSAIDWTPVARFWSTFEAASLALRLPGTASRSTFGGLAVAL